MSKLLVNRPSVCTLQIVGFDMVNDKEEYPAKDADYLGGKIYLGQESPGVLDWSAYGGLDGFEIDLRKLDPRIKVLRFWAQ
jgi:hypothetical protein